MFIAKLARITYAVCCCVGTICSIVLVLTKYFLNEDQSVIFLKSFDKSSRIIYPDITICFRAENDGLYQNQYVLSKIGLNGTQYRDALMGNNPNLNSTSFTKLSFDEATMNLQNYLTKCRVLDFSNNNIISFTHENFYSEANTSSKSEPIFTSYQDPTLICYTHQSDLDINGTVNFIDFHFNLTKLRTFEGGILYIFVHYKNQLIRHMKYMHKIRDFLGISQNNNNNYLIFDLNDIRVIKMREDANEPCNAELKNDDMEWMARVIKLVGCIPSYWKLIYPSPNNPNNECNTTKQFKALARNFPRDNVLASKEIFRQYRPPCQRMRVLANTNFDRNDDPEEMKIKFRFRLSQNNFILFL